MKNYILKRKFSSCLKKKEKLLSRGGEIALPWVVFANSVVRGNLVVKSSWVDWSVSAGGNAVRWLALNDYHYEWVKKETNKLYSFLSRAVIKG